MIISNSLRNSDETDDRKAFQAYLSGLKKLKTSYFFNRQTLPHSRWLVIFEKQPAINVLNNTLLRQISTLQKLKFDFNFFLRFLYNRLQYENEKGSHYL